MAMLNNQRVYLSLITIQPQNQPNPGIKWEWDVYINIYKYASHVVTTRFEPWLFQTGLLDRSLCTLFRQHGMTFWDLVFHRVCSVSMVRKWWLKTRDWYIYIFNNDGYIYIIKTIGYHYMVIIMMVIFKHSVIPYGLLVGKTFYCH